MAKPDPICCPEVNQREIDIVAHELCKASGWMLAEQAAKNLASGALTALRWQHNRDKEAA
jgi:hypothetical protein